MTFSDRIKSQVSLRAVAEAAGVVWDRKKTVPARGDYWAPCPFHAEKTASFHVVEKAGVGGWFKCFGCGAGGSVIDFEAQARGCDALTAMKALADGAGLERETDPAALAQMAKARARKAARDEKAAQARARRLRERAAAIWREARPDHPALAAYLLARGVNVEALGGVPRSLRYHPALAHRSPQSGKVIHTGPAMVAYMKRGEAFAGVHRTWIALDGRARGTDGDKLPKMMLGETFGASIPLSLAAPEVVVGEGIETTLAAFAAFRLAGRADLSAECAASLGAMAGPEDAAGRGPDLGANGRPLPSALPDVQSPRPGWLPRAGVTHAIVLADPSSRCPGSAERHALRAAAKLRARGIEASLRVPRGRFNHDDDFADLAKLEGF